MRITSTWDAELYTFVTISCWSLRIKNVSHKNYRRKQETSFMLSVFFFWKLCHIWGNVEKWATVDNKVQCMHISCYRHTLSIVIQVFHCKNGYMNVSQYYVYTYISFSSNKSPTRCRPNHEHSMATTMIWRSNQRLLLQLLSSWWWAGERPIHVELWINVRIITEKLLLLVGDLFELYDDAWTYKP
jgi:hypothetical protein